MNANNAKALLSLISQHSIEHVLHTGAMDAVAELVAIANGTHPVSKNTSVGGMYLTIPYTNAHGLRKVSAIKTIRVMFGMGLKDAKDMFDEAMLTGVRLVDGAVSIGPLSYDGVPYQIAKARLVDASSRNDDLLPLIFIGTR